MSIPMPNLGLIWIVFGLTMAGCDAPVKPIPEPDGRYCSPGLLKAVMAGDVSQIHCWHQTVSRSIVLEEPMNF
jgi:hypothetical protein